MGRTEYRILVDWPAYRVGDDGSIWSRLRRGRKDLIADSYGEWRQLKTTCDNDGVRQTTLHDGDRSRRIKVAAIVCGAFHGPAPAGMVCYRHNENTLDDRAVNLYWRKRKRFGGRPSLKKPLIKKLLALKGKILQRAAAEMFGVSQPYVSRLWSEERRSPRRPE